MRYLITGFLIMIAPSVMAARYTEEASKQIFELGEIIVGLGDNWVLVKYKKQYFKCKVNVRSDVGLWVSCLGKD